MKGGAVGEIGARDRSINLFRVDAERILHRYPNLDARPAMTFILAADGRDDNVSSAFERYRSYVEASRDRFPTSAYELASSDWYFNFNDHRSPHDAWLEVVSIFKSRSDIEPRKRELSLTVRLLGAYQDGFIELRYPLVHAYSMAIESGGRRDWRYDELRVSDNGHLIHEIEWWGATQSGRWLIEANGLEFTWIPDPVA